MHITLEMHLENLIRPTQKRWHKLLTSCTLGDIIDIKRIIGGFLLIHLEKMTSISIVSDKKVNMIIFRPQIWVPQILNA
jgi:hypothetical protein